MRFIDKVIKNKTLYGMIMVFIMWYVLHIVVKSNVIPHPYKSIKEFIIIFPNIISKHLFASVIRILMAISLSLMIGVPLGLWLGRNKGVDAIVSPVIYILYPLPKIAFLPVFMILFGIGDIAKIALIVSIIVFQILISTRDGVKEIPRELFYSVNSMGASRVDMYKHLIIPAVLPRIISGLRVSTGISISALFFAENFATTYGIGYYIMNAWVMVDYQDMFSGILALSILGIVLFKVLDILEKKLCPWAYVN